MKPIIRGVGLALLAADKVLADNNHQDAYTATQWQVQGAEFPAPIDQEAQTIIHVSDLYNKLDAQATHENQMAQYSHPYSGDSEQDNKYFKIITEIVAQMTGNHPIKRYDTSRIMSTEERRGYEDSTLTKAIEIYKFRQMNDCNSNGIETLANKESEALANIAKVDEMMSRNPKRDRKYGGAPELYGFLGDYFFGIGDKEMAMRLYSIAFSATKLPLEECHLPELYECKKELGRYSKADLEIYKPKTLLSVVSKSLSKAAKVLDKTEGNLKTSAKVVEVKRLKPETKDAQKDL